MRAGTNGNGATVRRMLLPAAVVLVALAGAAEPNVAGMVVAVRGEVTVVRADGTSAPLALKDSVWQGDQVRTGERGRVQISFAD